MSVGVSAAHLCARVLSWASTSFVASFMNPFWLLRAWPEVMTHSRKLSALALRGLYAKPKFCTGMMSCGCCSYVCPAHRPLVDYNSEAKSFVRKYKAALAEKEGGK